MGYTQSAISWYKTFQERAVERTKTVEKRPRYLILSLLHISREKISIKRILALCFSITMVESEEQDSRGLRAVVLHTAFFTIMMVLSLAGNVLICMAFYRNKSLRTITNFYVLSLAVVDLMVAVFVFPSVTAASGLRKWPFSHEFCQFTGFLTNYWVFVSLSILALTAINRYVCVVKPQHYSFFFSKKKTMISICFVWIFMFIFYLVFIVALQATFEWQPNALHCRVTFPDENTTKVVYIGFGICTSLSMLFVLFGYCGVYRVIWRHKNAVSFHTWRKQPRRITSTGNKNLSGSFRRRIRILCLLDARDCHESCRVCLEDIGSFLLTVDAHAVFLHLCLDQPDNLWGYESSDAKGVWKHFAALEKKKDQCNFTLFQPAR